ncbi:ankyrin repeat domain-containing protein 13D-like [Lytechinus variegatus]|uniref:ankyrin repeat domain-containing protein 13D-like n=1 Tax=Lytechinus variegatus TaxID=7654 RepID=UPI001BB283D5|nr:ankyrin repeat domain-containing protein 13D-like [Lytechinus variegatus]
MSHIPSVATEFPIHWAIWHNNLDDLNKELSKKENDKEKKDPRGRTPLHLAVTLGHIECVRVLLRYDADVTIENKGGWTVIQEATSTGDPELVQLILQHRDHQRATARIGGIPELLEKLRQAPDFYVEMRWEFTSWVPLMSRMCPSDTYRVWKSGPNVRIDTTLIGFDNMNWVRGSRSYVFKNEDRNQFEFMEIDHDAKVVYSEMLELQAHHDVSRMQPSENAIAQRLTSPVSNTYIDTEKIEFTRTKAGIWGWRHDKVETINDYECKVFTANNVQLVTKNRTEHLTKEDKDKVKADGPAFSSPLQSLLGVVEQQEQEAGGAGLNVTQSGTLTNPTDIKPEEYFNERIPLEGRDVGRPREVTTKVQKFRATLWLSENHPLSLQEQVLPIIDLMAISNAHFAKLRDFITLQLPAGFPVKIEIPLFHVINACVTFGNLYAKKQPVTGVSNEVIESLSEEPLPAASEDLLEGEGASPKPLPPATICVVDPHVFDIPGGYSKYRSGESQVRYGEDELLQLAIQQSLLEQQQQQTNNQDEVGFIDALGETENLQSIEDKLLERAIQESLLLSQTDESNNASGDQPSSVSHASSNHTGAAVQSQLPPGAALPPQPSPGANTTTKPPITTSPLPARPAPIGCEFSANRDDELRLALELSERERLEADKRRQEEDEELQRILQLSLTEK